MQMHCALTLEHAELFSVHVDRAASGSSPPTCGLRRLDAVGENHGLHDAAGKAGERARNGCGSKSRNCKIRNPGKWKHGLQNGLPLLFNFEPPEKRKDLQIGITCMSRRLRASLSSNSASD